MQVTAATGIEESSVIGLPVSDPGAFLLSQ